MCLHPHFLHSISMATIYMCILYNIYIICQFTTFYIRCCISLGYIDYCIYIYIHTCIFTSKRAQLASSSVATESPRSPPVPRSSPSPGRARDTSPSHRPRARSPAARSCAGVEPRDCRNWPVENLKREA